MKPDDDVDAIFFSRWNESPHRLRGGAEAHDEHDRPSGGDAKKKETGAKGRISIVDNASIIIVAKGGRLLHYREEGGLSPLSLLKVALKK